MTTKGGKPSAKARKKTGMRGKGKQGKYPVFSQASCISACRLRHHGKGVTASAVLAKCSRWANSHNNSACKAAVKRARETDRRKRK